MQQGKVAIVTGASSGIGEAAARSLARRGFALALVARRAERLEALAKEIEAAGGRALAIPADLVREEDTARVVPATLGAFGRVDVLVNNAGYGKGGPAELLAREDWRRNFEVNLFAGMQLVAAVAPVMRRQGGGRIVQVSSLIGHLAMPMASIYCASKAALERGTDSLRVELAPWNIDVVLVIPGTVDTPTFDLAREDARHLREDPGNPYRSFMEGMDRLAESEMKRAPKAEALGEVVAEAATAARPKARYFAPLSARVAARLASVTPARLLDKALLAATRKG